MRSLIDCGADLSLINTRILKYLENCPKLLPQTVNLQTVKGKTIDVIGSVELKFSLRGKEMIHKFYVCSDISRNMILGRDWMAKYGVQLFFDTNVIRMRGCVAPMIEDSEITSLVRLQKSVTIEPQTTTVCTGIINRCAQISDGDMCILDQVDNNFISSEPGLIVVNSISRYNSASRKIPVVIVNNTNRHYCINSGKAVV